MMMRNDNYPPGVTSATYGAPWNDIEVFEDMTFTLECTLSYSLPGPCSEDQEEDSKIDARREIISKMRIALENIDEVDNVIIE